MDIAETQFAQWCRRLNESDRSAFEELFRATYPMTLAYATHFLQSEAAAEDVVQDAFLRIWKARRSLDAVRSLRALLFVTVRRLALNALEKEARAEPLEHAMENRADDLMLEESADARQLAARLRSWIDALPERRREAFQWDINSHLIAFLYVLYAPNTSMPLTVRRQFLLKPVVQ